MRRRRLGGLAIALLVLAGCAPAPSDGGLWDHQALQEELVVGRLSTDQRTAAAQATELQLVDEQLASEDTRLTAELATCPGLTREPLQASPADRVRDSMRLRAGGDAPHQQRIANQALADWYLRRARQTGNAVVCTQARAALAGQRSPAPDTGNLGNATVTRAPGYPGDVLQPATPEEAVTLYGLAWTDTLHAPSPLPQYLAATYGGTPSLDSPGAAIAKSEDQVDTLAPAYPAWEPDAIWQALSTR